jgi:hypothetical protein
MKIFTTTIVAAISFAMVVHAGDHFDHKCSPMVRPCSKRGLDSRGSAFSMSGTASLDNVEEDKATKNLEATKDD